MVPAKEAKRLADKLLSHWTTARADGRLLPTCGPIPLCAFPDSFIFGTLLQTKFGSHEHEQPTGLGLTAASLIRWVQHGTPQFQLTAGSATAFVLTDVDDVRWEDVRFPFESYVIRFPAPSPLTFIDFDMKERDVTSVIVTQGAVPSVDEYEVSAIMRTVQSLWDAHAPVDRFASVLDRLQLTQAVYVEANDDFAGGIHRIYKIPEDRSTPVADWCDPDVPGIWQHERSRHAMSLVCRVVACLSLYLDHTDGPEKRWDPSLLQKHRLEGKTTTWTIGREIKLPKELRETARHLGRADRSPLKWKLQSRQCVRGYFRNQPYGPSRRDRRKQWIAPYWRGPEAAEVVNRLYTVGSESR